MPNTTRKEKAVAALQEALVAAQELAYELAEIVGVGDQENADDDYDADNESPVSALISGLSDARLVLIKIKRAE